MLKKIEVFAPAKINLYLKIVGKRPDGFHALETLMVPITVGDLLTVSLKGEGDPSVTMTCDRADLPADPTNLAWRAARLFIERFGIKEGVDIALTKRVPVGAGLGGGSSDGAHVLLALRQLTGVAASDADLAEIAARLGSDVPFFIYRRPALCTGRGEIIEPVAAWSGADTEAVQGLLVHPGFGVPTPWAYQTYAQNPQPGSQGPEFSFGALRNDLEPPVFSKYLWLPTAKEWFTRQPGVVGAMMSGSGSSVFALLGKGGDAAALAAAFRKEFGENLFAEPFKVWRP
ncbi:4-diphosphocytidyl-2-C-methyl-D-erythritol kinase [Verrucomicrobium sp. GAS474]|uniref:4-(cytidine 5'-diphospho)-2-C-methyl-D-erythritol kinase n=1 Tax=Verrucomicrobium sp. GAS474 TaxID=1882831 RepID=UPI000879B9EB|nr:4-(cytidine 5'-diphospho)-2-C-methyl-D-erythritol kinase [Verrucomicrobium sp. GAS474]SDU22401.1 4-diphosphocytidyl-2-C-methyl-D-erythritol kinase [Verrucomicrobium sp. GAS474]